MRINGTTTWGRNSVQSIVDVAKDEWQEAYATIKELAFKNAPSGTVVEIRRRIDGSHGNYAAPTGIAWVAEPGIEGELFELDVETAEPNWSEGYVFVARLLVP